MAVAELLRGGMELGDADDLVFGRENSKQANGAIGLLTDNVIDREAYYIHALVMALARFKKVGTGVVKDEEAVMPEIFAGLQGIERVLLSIAFIVVAAAVSRWQESDLEKDLMIATVRSFVQLIAIGYVLELIFELDNPLFTVGILVIMTITAGRTTAKRAKTNAASSNDRAAVHRRRLGFDAGAAGGAGCFRICAEGHRAHRRHDPGHIHDDGDPGDHAAQRRFSR